MADEKNAPGGAPQPSKLNPTKNGTGDTDKIKLGQSGQNPPKIQLRAAEEKKSTTRIDLADVLMPSSGADDIKELSPDAQAEFFKKSTIRISDAAAASAAQPASISESKRTTMRMDQTSPIGSGETQKTSGETGQIDVRRSTIRISDSPAPASETARVDAKRSTVRVDQPPPGATQQMKGETNRMEVKRSTIRIDGSPAGGETQQMQGETSRIDVKKSTIRIDSIPQSGSETQRAGTGGETKRIDLKTLETGQMSAAKDQTSQMSSPSITSKMSETQQHKAKSETTRLAIPEEVVKRQTGRIQPVETQDVFKKRTGKVSTAPVAVAPVVPMAPPSITPAAMRNSGTDTVARPKTILVRRPGRTTEAPAAVSAIEPTQQLAQRKSETARLEIPKEVGADDRPQTRPKTIRIKRPDGTTARKALTIARPEEGDDSQVPEKYRAPGAVAAVGDASPGGFWAVLAIAACLVLVGVVVYLLAQTYQPDFIQYLPGRVG